MGSGPREVWPQLRSKANFRAQQPGARSTTLCSWVSVSGTLPAPADISSRSFYSGLHYRVPPTEPQTSALSSLSNFPHLRILRSHMSCLLSPPLQVQPHLRSVLSATSPKCASCIVTLRYVRSYDVFALKKVNICECPGFPIHRKQWVGG